MRYIFNFMYEKVLGALVDKIKVSMSNQYDIVAKIY